MTSRNKTRVILGSRSPARRTLLEDAGFDVRVIEPEVEEIVIRSAASAEEDVHRNAWLKAQAVVRRVETGLVVTADTIVLIEGEVLGKPHDRDDAERMLRFHSSRPVKVLTGLCLSRSCDSLCVSTVETTTLSLRRMGKEQIESYLDSGAWQGTSGAYGIHGPDDPLIERIDGSVSNVIGLPLERLRDLIDEFPSLLVT